MFVLLHLPIVHMLTKTVSEWIFNCIRCYAFFPIFLSFTFSFSFFYFHYCEPPWSLRWQVKANVVHQSAANMASAGQTPCYFVGQNSFFFFFFLPSQITQLVNWKIDLSRPVQCGQASHLIVGPTFIEQENKNYSCSQGLKTFFPLHNYLEAGQSSIEVITLSYHFFIIYVHLLAWFYFMVLPLCISLFF